MNRFAQQPEQPDPELESPNVRFQPGRNEIARAIKILQRMDPNYFKGVREIVVTPGAYYGFVESGEGKDPSVIHVNADKIVQESGQEQGPEAAIATAITIAHEKGHVASYNMEQGFVGGESPAQQEENKVKGWIENNRQSLDSILANKTYDIVRLADVYLAISTVKTF